MKTTKITNEELMLEADSACSVTWIESVDWKASPEDTLEAIDNQLATMGYEIEIFDDGSDSVVFRIIHKEA